jgi:hypothetical protein
MRKIYSFLSIFLFLSLSIGSFGQTNTYSPYSRFGLGDLSSTKSGFSRGMGGTGVGLQIPNQINFLNPAAQTAQDTLSFVFDVGLSGNYTTYATSLKSTSRWNSSFSHLGLGFPITRWMAANFGAQPFSSVGYNITSPAVTLPDLGLVSYSNIGTGDLNRYFLGLAAKIKNLSLGINGYYMLGTLSYDNTTLPEDVYSYATETSSRYVVKDVYFGLGAQYKININPQTTMILGATYDFKSNLRATESKLQTQFLVSEFTSSPRNTADTLYIVNEKNNHITIPAKLGLGASINFKKKLTIAFDFIQQDWTKFQIPTEYQSNTNAYITKSTAYHFGVQYIPNYMAIRGYLPHVSYRFGGHFEDSYLSLNGQKLKDYGLSFGIGLPFKGSKNMLHFNYEIGRRGTTDGGLIKEKYNLISISLSFYDFWFVKPKFD